MRVRVETKTRARVITTAKIRVRVCDTKVPPNIQSFCGTKVFPNVHPFRGSKVFPNVHPLSTVMTYGGSFSMVFLGYFGI